MTLSNVNGSVDSAGMLQTGPTRLNQYCNPDILFDGRAAMDV